LAWGKYKVKTDKRDARTLAEACRLGAYRYAHRTSDRQRHVRAILAVREALVRTKSRYISLINTLLRRDGFRSNPGHARCFLKRLAQLELPITLREEIAPLVLLLQSLNEQIDKADEQLAQIPKRMRRSHVCAQISQIGRPEIRKTQSISKGLLSMALS
jgi:transposase